MVLLRHELIPLGVEVHQILSGREIAKDIRNNPIHRMAYQMANYCYIIVEKESKNAMIIDGGGWDVEGVIEICKSNGWNITHSFFTHRHFDHTGGKIPRQMTGGRDVSLPGVADYVAKAIPVYVGERDLSAISKQSLISAEKLLAVGNSSKFDLNSSTTLEVIETPGHTSGSVCFLLTPKKNASMLSSQGSGIGGKTGILFTGDTLFIGSCGRVDLPESDVSEMLSSLNELSKLSSDTVVLPGHNYSPDNLSTIGNERQINMMMQQAMQRFQRTQRGVQHGTSISEDTAEVVGLNSEPVVSFVALPDYLLVARSIYREFALAQNSCIEFDCLSELRGFGKILEEFQTESSSVVQISSGSVNTKMEHRPLNTIASKF